MNILDPQLLNRMAKIFAPVIKLYDNAAELRQLELAGYSKDESIDLYNRFRHIANVLSSTTTKAVMTKDLIYTFCQMYFRGYAEYMDIVRFENAGVPLIRTAKERYPCYDWRLLNFQQVKVCIIYMTNKGGLLYNESIFQ